MVTSAKVKSFMMYVNKWVSQSVAALLLSVANVSVAQEAVSLADELLPLIVAVQNEHTPGGTLYTALHSSAAVDLGEKLCEVPHHYDHHEVLAMATAFDTSTPEGQVMARGLTLGAQFENVESIWLLSSLVCVTLDWKEVPLELQTRGVLPASAFRGSLARKIYYLLNGEILPKGLGQVVLDRPLEWLKSELESAKLKWGVKHQDLFNRALKPVEERLKIEAKVKAELEARRQSRMWESTRNGGGREEISMSGGVASDEQRSAATSQWIWISGILLVIVMIGTGLGMWIRRRV
jgi:hypothetical protein